MPRSYTVTYDRVTPESAEDGDTSEAGFYVAGGWHHDMKHEPSPSESPEAAELWESTKAAATCAVEPDEYDIEDAGGEESRAAVALMVRVLRDEGASEPSCSNGGPDTWYTTPDGHEDYTTGERTTYSYHLNGWTEAEQRAIYAAVTGRE